MKGIRYYIIVAGIGTAATITIPITNHVSEKLVGYYVKYRIDQRDQRVQQIYSQYHSPSVGEVHYDHYGSKIEKICNEYASRALDDPMLKKFISDYQNDLISRLYGRGINQFGLTEEDLGKFSESAISDNRANLEKILAKRMLNHINFRRGTGSGAVTVQYPLDFGNGATSDIYVFKEAFENMKADKIERNGKIVPVKVEDQLSVILMQRTFEAESNFNGIILATNAESKDVVKIDRTNFSESDPNIRYAAIEIQNYTATMERFLKLPSTFNPNGMPYINNPTYMMSLVHFLNNGKLLLDFLDEENKKTDINNLERSLMEIQNTTFDEIFENARSANIKQ